MTHLDCIERLPWYLTGALDPAERSAIQDHLDHCADCRRELAATRVALELFAAEHPSTTELVDAIWDRVTPARSAAIEHHAATCPTCREELTLLATSRALEAAAGSERPVGGASPASGATHTEHAPTAVLSPAGAAPAGSSPGSKLVEGWSTDLAPHAGAQADQPSGEPTGRPSATRFGPSTATASLAPPAAEPATGVDTGEAADAGAAVAGAAVASSGSAVARPAAATRRPVTRWLPLAALLAAGVGLGWLGLAYRELEQQSTELRAEVWRARETGAADLVELDRLRRQAASLEARLATFSIPRAGLPLVELLPFDTRRGAGGAAVPTVVIPAAPALVAAAPPPAADAVSPAAGVAGASAPPFVLLLLALADPTAAEAWEARLFAADGTPLWAAPPASADRTGALTLLVPAAGLPAGNLTLELHPVGAAVEASDPRDPAGAAAPSGRSGGPTIARYRLRVSAGSQPTTTNDAQ